MRGGLVRIEGDLFSIAERLKEVDERYELYFNARLGRFEVHAGGALQLAVPFDRLDARTVELARRTRVENAERLVGEIDRDNARLERDAQNRKKDMLLAAAEEVYESKRYSG